MAHYVTAGYMNVFGCVYLHALLYYIDNLSVNGAIHNGLRKVLVDCHGTLTRRCILSRYIDSSSKKMWQTLDTYSVPRMCIAIFYPTNDYS